MPEHDKPTGSYDKDDIGNRSDPGNRVIEKKVGKEVAKPPDKDEPTPEFGGR